jgi:hypothetical protein
VVADPDGFLRSYYQGSIKDDLEGIQFYQRELSEFTRIRETHQEDWQIVELCREILWEITRQIKYLHERIEDARRALRAIEATREESRTVLGR